MIEEVCSCGASLTLDISILPISMKDAWGKLELWRVEHYHDTNKAIPGSDTSSDIIKEG